MRAAPLVGRREELDLAVGLLEDDHIGGLVLAGAPGVGKTRLASELADLAQRRGRAVAWATATRATASIPLGAVAHLVPLTEGSGLGVGVGVEELNAVTLALIRLAGDAGLVLVIDDAQHLDDVTAALALQLARLPSVFLVVTLRSGERPPDAIVSLWKDGLAERLDLQLLSRDDVFTLVQSLVEGPVDAHTRHRIWDITRGNPMFVREVVLDGLEARALHDAGGVWTWIGPLSAGARLEEIVEGRIAGVVPAQRELLELLAIGEPLSLDVLGELVDVGLAADLERRGLVRVDEQGPRPQLLMAHPLYAEVLRSRMPVTIRRDLMGRLADVAEAAASGPEDLVRVAMWRLDSGAPVTQELLVAAASRANGLHDRTLAERTARAALALGPSTEATIALAEALNATLRFEEAAELLLPLVHDPPPAMTDAARVRLASSLQESLFWGQGDIDRSTQSVTAVMDQTTDAAAAHYIEALLGSAMYFAGATDDAAALARRFVHDSTIDSIARLRAIPAIGALALEGHAFEALELTERMAGLVVDHVDRCPDAMVWLPSVRGVALYLLGRVEDAELVARMFHDIAAATGDENTGTAATSLGVLAVTRGYPETALTWLREALVLLQRHDPNLSRPWALAIAAWAEALRGHTDTAVALMKDVDASFRPAVAVHAGFVELARAWVQLKSGDSRAAVTTVLAAAATAEKHGQRAARLTLMHEALRLGARDRMDAIIAEAATGVDGDLAATYVAHARALLANDGEALDKCAVAFDRMGLTLLAAEAAAEAAMAYRGGGLTSSAQASAARSARWAQRCEGARTPALEGALEPTALTRREREIAVLAARGMSNAEIAGHLTVSVRTVEGHLYNAYAKLGVSDRSALAEILG